MSKSVRSFLCSLGLLFSFCFQANATHIYGGDISYVYVKDTLGGTEHIYEITLTMYQDCNSANWNRFFPENQVPVSIYEGVLNATRLPLSSQKAVAQLTLIDTSTIKSNLPGGCALTGGSCINKTVYFGRVSVPTTFTGYHFIYDRCCRTSQVTNINVPAGSTSDGTLLHSWTASTSTKNTSPKFRDFDFPFICIGKENSVLNIAQDPDGDLLNYSLYAPFDGLAQNGNYTGGYPAQFPPSSVNYRTTPDVYTDQKPLGNTNGSISLNGLTGYTTMRSNASGIYVVGVKVTEIDKNGKTIGVVHREYQFPFVACNDTNSTTPQLAGSGKTDFEIDAGDTLCFDMEFEDKGGSPINYLYRVEGLIFDTNFTKPAAKLGAVTFTPGKSKQEFCWGTTCSQGRPTKYFFTATVADSACIPAISNTVFSVLVNPPKTPSVINGPASLCAGASGAVYTTDTIPGITYNWTVNGGIIVSGGSGPTIEVDWGNGPGGNIKVFGTNANGCVGATIDKAVFVATFPVNAGRDTLICIGDTVVLGGNSGAPTAPNGYSIKWNPSTGLDNDTLANPKAFPTVTTNYVLSVTDSTGQCKVVDTVQVLVGVNPNASASNDTTLCEGNQTTLFATGGTKYTWSPGNLLNDSTIANPITNITSDQLFIVKIEDPGKACLTLDSVFVTIDEQADLDPGQDSSICSGLTHILGGIPTGVPNATFVWNPSVNLSSANDTNPVFTPTGTGTTKFFVTMTTPAGCVFSDSVEIRVDTLPDVKLLVGRDTICAQDTTFIQGTGGGSYVWNVTGITGAGPHIITPDSSFLYKVKVTDGNFCADSASQFIEVKSIPQINIPQDSIFLCNLDTIELSVPVGASGYLWTPPYNRVGNGTQNSVRVYPRTDTTYKVNITDFFGCDAVDSIHIQVGFTVPTDAGTPFTMCSPDTLSIGGSPTGPSFNTSFSWTPTNSLINPNSANPQTFADTTTMYVVTTTNGQCSGIDSVLVTVKKRPTLTFTRNPYNVCTGDTVQIDTLSSTGTITNIGVFPTPVDVIGGSGINLRIAPKSSAAYNIVLADANGCIDTSILSINVVPPPNVDAGKDTFMCAGTPFQLFATGASSYAWTPSELLDKPNSPTPVGTADSLTEFIVIGTTQAGCSGSDTVLINAIPLPKVDAGNPHVICSDTVTQLRLGGNPTGDASTQFVWSPSIDLDNPNSANPLCTFTLPRSYIVLGIDTNGCANSDTADIRLYSFKINDITADCSGDSIQVNLYDTFGTPPFKYEWTPTFGLSNPLLPNPVVFSDSSITYKVKVTDSVGCVDSSLVDVFVKSRVQAKFDLLVQADCENTTVTAKNLSENGDEYVWSLNGDVISDEESPVFTFPYESNFSVSLEVKSVDGCTDQTSADSATISFEDYFTGVIPNVFSPNGDGINDLFDFRLGNRLEQCSNILIYNRWGVLVFESRENAHVWDGRTFTGELCQPGVYFYILDVNGTTYKGSLTLVRN